MIYYDVEKTYTLELTEAEVELVYAALTFASLNTEAGSDDEAELEVLIDGFDEMLEEA